MRQKSFALKICSLQTSKIVFLDYVYGDNGLKIMWYVFSDEHTIQKYSNHYCLPTHAYTTVEYELLNTTDTSNL